jgi:2-(1,2-epoxy-1,2-dihydrophenyl)acetyl-CoA isomerase
VSELVQVERAEGVATITLNRPDRKNAITRELVEDLITAVQEVAASPEDRALVLTGAGGAFCSGMDLAAPLAPDVLTFMQRVGFLCELVHELRRPTLAKVRGPAVGFGANLALCCDLVVAGQGARFGEIFAQRGIALDGGASWLLPRLVGLQQAKRLAFFAETLDATEAERIGLVTWVVPDAELDKAAAEWAQRLADGPTLALSMIKSSLNSSYETAFRRAVETEALNQAVAFGTAEAREAGKAFSQKREPRFRS